MLEHIFFSFRTHSSSAFLFPSLHQLCVLLVSIFCVAVASDQFSSCLASQPQFAQLTIPPLIYFSHLCIWHPQFSSISLASPFQSLLLLRPHHPELSCWRSPFLIPVVLSHTHSFQYHQCADSFQVLIFSTDFFPKLQTCITPGLLGISICLCNKHLTLKYPKRDWFSLSNFLFPLNRCQLYFSICQTKLLES